MKKKLDENVKCPLCGTINLQGFSFCRKCGTNIEGQKGACDTLPNQNLIENPKEITIQPIKKEMASNAASGSSAFAKPIGKTIPRISIVKGLKRHTEHSKDIKKKSFSKHILIGIIAIILLAFFLVWIFSTKRSGDQLTTTPQNTIQTQIKGNAFIQGDSVDQTTGPLDDISEEANMKQPDQTTKELFGEKSFAPPSRDDL